MRFSNPVRPSIFETGGNLALESPYNPEFVQALKNAIPAAFRTFDRERKLWIFSPQYGQVTVDLVYQYFHSRLNLPKIESTSGKKVLRVSYIGTVKQRTNGTSYAAGWMNNGWKVIFPEDVIRSWFGAADWKPGQRQTLYGVLGIPVNSGLADVKSAYKRLARVWHPDVNQERDAEEQFKRINEAHQVLSDPLTKKKYDTGLEFELLAPRQTKVFEVKETYRPPLRNGLITAEGVEGINGSFNVSKILSWDDIIEDNKIMISFWRPDTDGPEIIWKPLQPTTDFFND